MAARRPTVRSRPRPTSQGRIGLWCAAAFAAVTVVGAADARARAPADVALDYGADKELAECPSAATFKDEIARQLGHDPFRESAPRRIVVRLYARRAGIEGHIEWRDPAGESRGERKFWSRNESCAQLTHAIALVTAIQIQLLETAQEGRNEERNDSRNDGRDENQIAGANAPSAPATSRPSPAPMPAEPARASSPPPPEIAPTPKEPWLAADAGVGVLQDLGDGPAMVIPRIAISVGRPSSYGLRLAANGLGPGSDVTRLEGIAHLARFFMTLEVIRSFRVGRSIEPTLGLGGGWQDVQVHGISAMPSLAQAHDARAFSFVAAASAGLAFAFAVRLAIAVEVEGLLYRPAVTVQIGSGQAARLDGAAVVVHGGLLARF